MKSDGLRTYAIDRVQTRFGTPHSAEEHEFLCILMGDLFGEKKGGVLFSNVG